MFREYSSNIFLTYKRNFRYFFAFAIALFLMEVLELVLFYLISPYDGGLISVLVGWLIFFPFVFDFLSVIGEASSGEKINYSSFGKHHKEYFSPRFRGIFNSLLTFIFFILIQWLCLIVFTMIYVVFNQEIILSLYEQINDSGVTMNIYNQVINLPNYIYVYLASDIVACFFFLYRIFRYSYDAFSSFALPIPYRLAHLGSKVSRQKISPALKKCGLIYGLIYAFIFLIGCIIGMCIALFCTDITSLNLIEVIMLGSGLLLTFAFNPLMGILTAYQADDGIIPYLQEIKAVVNQNSSLISQNDNNPSLQDINTLIDNRIKEIKSLRASNMFHNLKPINKKVLTRALKTLNEDLKKEFEESFKLFASGKFVEHMEIIKQIREKYLQSDNVDKDILELFNTIIENDELLLKTVKN